MTQNVSPKIASNTIIQVAGRLLQAFLGLGTAAILMETLGIKGFGNYSLVLAYAMFFGALTDLGFIRIMVREISELGFVNKTVSSDKLKKVRLILGTGITTNMIFTLSALVLVTVLVSFLNYESELKLAIMVGLVGEFFGSLRLSETVLRVKMKMKYATLALLLTSVVTFSSAFILFKLNPNNLLIWMAAGWTLARLISSSVTFFFANREFKIWPFKFDKILSKKMLVEGIPLGLAVVLATVYYRVDAFMLKGMSTDVELGFYGAAYKFVDILIAVPSFFLIAASPVLADRLKNNFSKFKRAYQRAFLLLIIVVIPIMGFMIILAPSILGMVFGDKASGSIEILRILSLAFPFIFMSYLYESLLIALRKKYTFLFMAVLGAVLNISLNIYLIPNYDGAGAAIATFITTFVLISFSLLMVHRKIKVSPPYRKVSGVILSGFITLSIFIFVGYFSKVNMTGVVNSWISNMNLSENIMYRLENLIITVVFGALGLIVYGMLIYSLKVFNKDDLKNVLGKR